MHSLKKLIKASVPLSDIQIVGDDFMFKQIPVALRELYLTSNGFMALEGALVVYPIGKNSSSVELFSINNVGLWKKLYSDEILNSFFFSRDAFGGQYGVLGDNIYKLNPENGELKMHSLDIDDWAEKIMSDYDYETGWSLARAWQLENNSRLEADECLIPKRPFSIGGDFEITNLEKKSLFDAMNKYGNLYQQVKDAVQGESISIQW